MAAPTASTLVGCSASDLDWALFFDHDIKRVTELAWDQAVNDTANLWQSILWNTFGPVRAGQMYGIPAPVREIGNGSAC